MSAQVPPFQQSSRTSRLAAEKLAPKFPSLKDRIEDRIKECGHEGQSREELAVALGVKEGTVCGAVNSLMHEGKIHVSATVSRVSSLGNEVEVLVAVVAEGGTQAALFGLETANRKYH